ncbi:hypothetical protein Ancab_033177, partial [Ancistrocladus abbreviatus]
RLFEEPRLERERDSRICGNSSCEQDGESKTSAPEKAEAKIGSDSKQVSRNSMSSKPSSPSSSTSSQ